MLSFSGTDCRKVGRGNLGRFSIGKRGREEADVECVGRAGGGAVVISWEDGLELHSTQLHCTDLP